MNKIIPNFCDKNKPSLIKNYEDLKSKRSDSQQLSPSEILYIYHA